MGSVDLCFEPKQHFFYLFIYLNLQVKSFFFFFTGLVFQLLCLEKSAMCDYVAKVRSLQDLNYPVLNGEKKKCCITIQKSLNFKMVMNAAFNRSIDFKIKYRCIVSVVLKLRWNNIRTVLTEIHCNLKNHHLSDLKRFAVYVIF